MTKETILIIEDEQNIIELVKYNLGQVGFRILTAVKGDAGLEKARKEKPDLIILDLMLPGLDGIEICKTLKQNNATAHIPIIMLTAKSQETDKVIGLELGADDYVTKPFSPKELVARVKAVLRGIQKRTTDKVLKAGGLEMDTGKCRVTLKGKPVELSSKEYEILKVLMEAEGRVLQRDYFFNEVWGHGTSFDTKTRTLDVHIRHLREKLKSEAHRIVTVKYVGYRFDFGEE